MIVLDVTIVGVALPSIHEDLGFSETSLAWVVNAYLLTFGGFLLLGGRLGDLFGHRRLFLPGSACSPPRRSHAGSRRSQAALDRRAGGAGRRRRDRLRRRAVADHDALHRARRAREGDGRVRLRRRGRRLDRRAARRGPDGRARWHWIFLVNVPIGIAVVVFSLLVLPGGRGRRARSAARRRAAPSP